MTLKVPKFGFGTVMRMADDKADETISRSNFKSLIRRALELGVRHFDCAPLYRTQRLVGETITEACQVLNIPRHQLFITSKLPINMMRPDHIEKSLRNSLQDLQLEYLDCFMLHAPFATKYIADDIFFPLDIDNKLLIDDTEGNQLDRTWLKMTEFKRQGLVKALGLSNVNINQLEKLHKLHKVDILQSEHHLYHQDLDLIDNCEELDIHFEAYAGFGCPPKASVSGYPVSLHDEVVKRIAKNKDVSPAQVIVKWLHEQPISYVITSDNCHQLEDNFKATIDDIKLSRSEMIELDNQNMKRRLFYYDNYHGITSHREYPFDKSQI